MDNISVYIRGIYTTALTKLFQDAGFEIIYPSEVIQNRFNIPYRQEKYTKDIIIRDRKDKQGVSINIKGEIYNKLVEESQFSEFPLSITKEPQIIQFNSNFNVNDIYKGKVIKSSKKRDYSFVELIPKEEYNSEESKYSKKFTTNLGHLSTFLPVGETGIFQVKRGDYGTHMPELEQNFTLAGDLLVLLPKADKVFISKKIQDSSERNRLLDLGKNLLKSKYFGIICRTAAKFATDEEIKKDFHSLEATYSNIQRLISKMPDETGRIYSDTKSLNLLFPYSYKRKLDEIRREITETIQFHHTIKSSSINENCMGKYYADENELLNYSEDLIEQLPDSQREAIEEFYLSNYYDNIKEGEWMDINHQKLSGRTVHLRGGKIESCNKDLNGELEIQIRRVFRKGGRYDGLDLPIDKGDYALSTFKVNSRHYVSKYYSSDDELKGKYININTPIEISSKKIQYIDLEIDVIEKENGKREIIDREKLDAIYELNLVSKTTYDQAIELANDLKSKNEL